MKKIIFGIAAAAILITGSIFVIAQRSGGMGGHGFGHGPGRHRGGIGMALRGLDLTDEQKAKVKEITDAAKTTVEPLMEQTRANHERIRALGTDGKFDHVQVEALAAEQGNLTAKLIVEKGKVKAQIFALLTDEQKAKAATMHSKFEEKFKSRKAPSEKPAGSEF
ncbi:MAG: Spy/CpxP family protein refolding chaperone [Pyrinomonadaceae bacterium]